MYLWECKRKLLLSNNIHYNQRFDIEMKGLSKPFNVSKTAI